MTVSVVRLRAADGGTDRYGDTEPGADAELTIDGCGIAPRLEGEDNTNGRHGVPIGWDLYAPFDADIEATDRIRLPDGTVCKVDGFPAKWEHMWTGWRPGQVVALIEYQG